MSGDGVPEPTVRQALARLAEARRAPYYDKAADQKAQRQYYGDVDADTSGDKLFAALSELVQTTHRATPRYKPHVELYPDVDLHPDGQLRSLYTDEVFAPEAFIAEDAETEQRRAAFLAARQPEAAAAGPAALAALEAQLEAALPYNCEHVVPQSWFAKDEPMRGDLHHLFACEKDCNSFRGNTAYFDFADYEVVREKCGKREDTRFEPGAGKGSAARATLYFLLRYPGLVNEGELEEDRLQILLDWHRAVPVTLYERHRNARIQARQGNRNPLIDHPDWAPRVSFVSGLA